MLYECGGALVEQIGGSFQGFCPVSGWHEGVLQEGADGGVDGAKHAFSFAILLRGVGALVAQGDALTREEISGGMIDELGTTISLKCFWGDTELRMSISDELNKTALNLRFVA